MSELNSRALNTALLGEPVAAEPVWSFELNGRPLNSGPLGGPVAVPTYVADVTVQYDDDTVASGATHIAPVAADVAITYDDDQVAADVAHYPAVGFVANVAIQYDDDAVSAAAVFITPVVSGVSVTYDDDVVQGDASVSTVASVAIQYADDIVSATATHLPAVNADVVISYDDDTVSSAAHFDWSMLIDPIVTQTYYACDVIASTGETIRVSISSWQATIQTGRQSYVQAVVPAANTVIDAIFAMDSPEFVIWKGARFDDGLTRETELARAPLQTPSINEGHTNVTLTMTGYAQFSEQSGGLRDLHNPRSQASGRGLRVRADIDWFLRPGQRARARGTEFVVSYINYYANGRDEYMDVGERAL